MTYQNLPLISEAGLVAARRELGTAFPRILGYYRQDGATSIASIEDAMQALNATAMVLPAHSLKGESRQLGVERLAEVAQHLEMTARRCIEERVPLPDTLAEDVRGLRALFHDTVGQLERIVGGVGGVTPRLRGAAPVQRPVFGRRAS